MRIDKQYIMQDFIGAEVARMYSNERKEVMYVAVGDNAGWDVRSAKGDFFVEVKMECSPIRTGNVAIEFYNTELKRHSGIAATEAHVWLHIALRPEGFIAYEYDAKVLRELIKMTGVRLCGGYNSLCQIIDIQTFEHHAKRVMPFHTHFMEEIMNKAMVGSDTMKLIMSRNPNYGRIMIGDEHINANEN